MHNQSCHFYEAQAWGSDWKTESLINIAEKSNNENVPDATCRVSYCFTLTGEDLMITET